VFILLCCLNYWLLFWCLGFLFVLVRHYRSCSLFFVHPFHFFVLASPSAIWKRMCCGPSEKSDYNKSDEPFIDLTERVPCAWMRSQGHTQHVRQQPQGARCPTFHPHHTFTHNPHHLILKIYNKTTITPPRQLPHHKLTRLVLLYGPCGHVISPPQQSQPHIVALQRCVSAAWVD